MRQYRVGKYLHKVYEPDDPFKEGSHVLTNWREGQIGDWVMADDDCIIQVLRKGEMKIRTGKDKTRSYIGTCTGTFPVNNKIKMDTSKREDIYSFGGNTAEDRLHNRKNLTKHEEMFVTFLSIGLSPEEAYMQAFPTNHKGYALEKSAQLVKTTRVRTAMKEELKPVLEELDIDEKLVLGNIKEVALSSEKDDTRLKALFKLADIMDLEDKNRTQVTQLSGAVFKGFSDELLEAVERPKEIKNGS